MENDSFTIEVEVTSQYYETVEFTFSQETLNDLNCKNKDELLARIQAGDEDIAWKHADDEHWDSHDSEIKHIYWEDAKYVD